jgi:prephenate dehydrogenase (NADP+)
MSKRFNVSPSDPVDQHPVIGLIGMGAMGKMYVKHLSAGGWNKYAVSHSLISNSPLHH